VKLLEVNEKLVFIAFNTTIRVYDITTDEYTILNLIGHKGNITSIKIVNKIVYTTSDTNEIIAWQIIKGEGFIVDQ
jgi:WD40 repeat protein